MDSSIRCFWFTVEFGLCRQEGKLKAFGAGLLSSFGELQYSLSGKPELQEFEPEVTGLQKYPITEYQPIYFVANSFEDAKDKMIPTDTIEARRHTCRCCGGVWGAIGSGVGSRFRPGTKRNRTIPSKTASNTFPKSIRFLKDIMKNIKFAKTIPRDFGVRYNPYTQSIDILDSAKQLKDLLRGVNQDMTLLISTMDKIQ
ncbi:Protein henna [Eumeta japonica]|uniref:phenylalanine 4-monooxygenase n=1 Tax=Eumeta variegata TaxID=151549 RepID=A0A4C2A5L3_EUMVA|nr:Protein henna [Eumeta japonica]